MKRKMFLLAGMMIASTILFAQSSGKHGQHMERQLERMKKELTLNDDQYNRIKSIREKFRSQFVALRADTAVTIGTLKKRTEKLKTALDAEIKTVLTEQQWNKWLSLKDKRENARKGQHHRG